MRTSGCCLSCARLQFIGVYISESMLLKEVDVVWMNGR